ncbi:Oxidoreductase [Psilocybe cubensis]|uniref:NAD(P)-binding protein n=2 Tax=Psilocybe cubensis TaxID=181762 RepID=A0A8H7XQ50_PSICU|nr:Oxidoreductase [Psilocybe cubensis]KAH9477951.1 Oxidoreductase [Psilocybe cubensis]
MPSLLDVSQANANYAPSYVPVMVVTGGTAGIGQSMANALARHLHGRIHIIIFGRNKSAAESFLASLPKTEESTYEFLECDLTLMQNVCSLAGQIKERVSRVNFLVHCAAVVGFGGRQETEEGIDIKLALRYYSRWVLTYNLLPLLQNAKGNGESSSVITVLGAGLGPEINLDNLGLKNSYKGLKAMAQSTAYNDLMVAEFSRQNPDISFTHIHPGVVYTGTISNQHLATKILVIPLRPLLWLLTTPRQDCAEYMLYAMLYANKGMNRRNKTGDDIGMLKFPQAENAQTLLWEHTALVTGTDS